MLFSDLFHSPTALATLPLAMQFSSVIWGILSVVLIITCLVLILIILLQDPKSAGLTSAFGGGGGGDSVLGAQAQRGVSRFTAILTTVFILICIALVLIENRWVPSSVGAVGANNIETTNSNEDGAAGEASVVPIDPDVDGTAPAGGTAPATPPVSGNGGNTPPPPTPPSGQ